MLVVAASYSLWQRARSRAASALAKADGIIYSAGSTTTSATEPEGLRRTVLGKTDFERDPVFQQRNRARRFLARPSPHICYGLVGPSGEVAAYIWLARAGHNTLEIPFGLGLRALLRPGEAYVWDCFTAEPYRNRGCYRELIRYGQQRSAEAGDSRVFIQCGRDNAPSRRGIERCGFRPRLAWEGRRYGPICVLLLDGQTRLTLSGQAVDFLGPARLD